MPVYTTEITSEHISSDNPLHQRLLKPYVEMTKIVKGDLLEVGCGEGRGVELLSNLLKSYTAIDKIEEVLMDLSEKYPQHSFRAMNIPPFKGIEDNSFDFVISFQVIEHIKEDRKYLTEIARVLKPGGQAYLTTPNRSYTLSRNPWHIREYLPEELRTIAAPIFSEVKMKGIAGNSKVMDYHDKNRKSVEKITRFDILDLQHRLPASVLRIPYEILNRLNRNRLENTDDALVRSITHEDYYVAEDPNEALDLFMVATK